MKFQVKLLDALKNEAPQLLCDIKCYHGNNYVKVDVSEHHLHDAFCNANIIHSQLLGSRELVHD